MENKDQRHVNVEIQAINKVNIYFFFLYFFFSQGQFLCEFV